jgi:hypothetical protein
LNNKKKYWPKPKGRSLSASSDLDLFYLSMNLAQKYGSFNKEILADELSERVKGLILIRELSQTALDKLLKELKAFGWVDGDITTDNGSFDIKSFKLTEEGKAAYDLYGKSKRKFLHLLIRKMQDEYTIPAWFVNRLWQINPEGQGQVIIPAPIKSWNPSGRLWENNNWDEELEEQTLASKKIINTIAKGSFEVQNEIWINEVKKAWTNQGKSIRKKYQGKKDVTHYSPRRRLALAMRAAAVQLLFNVNDPHTNKSEISSTKSPLEPRSFSAWCPRLDELELIFYTDFNPRIPGRIIFPVASFKNEVAIQGKYEEIVSIHNLKNEHICLHRPNWDDFRQLFQEVLFIETQNIYKKTRALYVSVQDVRDEVCRQLRISSSSFNEYLHLATLESLDQDSKFRISLETDIREDQRNSYQQRRRSVIINNKLISLIAITKAG